jgi:preprotein translocase SecF subunit
MIRVQQQAGGEAAQQQAIDKIRTALGTDVTYRRVESVGPQVGADLIKKGLWAVIGATAGILLYIMFRFQTPYAVGAVMALLHDVALTLGYFALTQTEFSLSTVAAVLTVAGYSINDTVVVFDRVREMLRKYQKRDIAEVLDIALTTTLSRTFFTGLSTLIALIALMIFGGPVIRSFVDAMIIGILAGTYSSIYVACPVLVKMQGMLGRPKVNEA